MKKIKSLLREFTNAEIELEKRKLIAEDLNDSNNDFFKAIRENLENKDVSIYANLAFEKSIGKSINDYKLENNIPQESNPINFLNLKQLEKLEFVENEMKSMIDSFKLFGFEESELYSKIKEIKF